MLPPINLKEWIETHREFLKPPVCNKLAFEENGFIIMIVGGPNQRTDYHYNEGPEFFYQVEGSILLKTIQEGQVVDIPIAEGEMFLLDPKVPHSPHRYENTVGLVIERRRRPGENDGLQWYCAECTHPLYEEYFELKNIVKDFPAVFDRFYASVENRTCDECGTVMPERDA